MNTRMMVAALLEMSGVREPRRRRPNRLARLGSPDDWQNMRDAGKTKLSWEDWCNGEPEPEDHDEEIGHGQ